MLTALWQDDEILVIDKPAGLATQPGAGIKLSLVEAVERDFGFRPFLVHRLDRETAGCIIVARNARAASRWTEMIAGRELGKFYRAVVAGAPRSPEGPLNADVRVRGEMVKARASWRLVGSFGAMRPAVGTTGDGLTDSRATRADSTTGSRTGASDSPRFSLLELELGTGRMHQLRLQLAGAGMPILGDEAHGDFPLNKELRKTAGLKRLLLQSWRLVLPGGGAVESPEPEHFKSFLGAFVDAPAWGGL
ncbi:MAG TPA: RluA family pseudouridine synthase [Rectinemataceae bacterium]|nr:RluA family pseudouridine synthase [Rectinemataceae bacterium]